MMMMMLMIGRFRGSRTNGQSEAAKERTTLFLPGSQTTTAPPLQTHSHSHTYTVKSQFNGSRFKTHWNFTLKSLDIA